MIGQCTFSHTSICDSCVITQSRSKTILQQYATFLSNKLSIKFASVYGALIHTCPQGASNGAARHLPI